MIKCQKNVIILFASQWYWLALFKNGKKNYYVQVFPENCKHVVKEKEVTGHITEDLEISFNEENSDKE